MNSFKCIEQKNVKILYIEIRPNGKRSNGIGSKGYHLENLNPYASLLFSQISLLLPGKLTKRSQIPVFQGKIRRYSLLDLFLF